MRARLGRAFFDADHVDPRTQTRKFDVAPCVMLVALADGEAELCATALKSLASKPLAVTRVAHIRAACERMLVTRPLIVVFSEAASDADKRMLKERAEDISAEIVALPPAIDIEALRESLFAAVREANLKSEAG